MRRERGGYPHGVATEQVIIGAPTITPEDLVRVAREGARIEATDAARERVARSRAVMDVLTGGSQAVYGLNTGLGAKCDEPLSREEMEAFQRSMLMARSVSLGPAVPTDTVRAMMFARACGMAQGGSGVQLSVFSLLVDMLNAGVHPVVAAHGSIGSADLGPLAQMALPMIGLGEAVYEGERLSGSEALLRASLKPAELGPKDGLSLCSANSASIGQASLVWHDTCALLDLLDLSFALSLEGLQGNVGPLDARVNAARPYPGQVETAERLRCLLARHSQTSAGPDQLPVRRPGSWSGPRCPRQPEADSGTGTELPFRQPPGAG
jgi:histidine ammonia-lyase